MKACRRIDFNWLVVEIHNDFFKSIKRWLRGPRPLRWFKRLILIPVWFLDQTLATMLDRPDFNPGEAPSYTAVAHNPGNFDDAVEEMA